MDIGGFNVLRIRGITTPYLDLKHHRTENQEGDFSMCRTKLTVLSRAIVLMVVTGTCALLPSVVLAQAGIPFGWGSDGGAGSENSRTPFPFKLSGVINPTTPNPERLALVPLMVGSYHEIYQFEVRTAELPYDPQGSPRQVLHNLSKYVVQLHLAGTRDLLTKIGQAYPGTPITIDGMFTPRSRQFVVLSVDVFHLDEHADHDQADK